MEDREQFRQMRIIEVKQRAQIIVVYEELSPQDELPDPVATRKEFVINSLDRPVPVPYEQ